MASESGQAATYDLASWTEDQRGDLEFLLREFQLPVKWDGRLLLVPQSAREVVDRQIEWLTQRQSADSLRPGPPPAPRVEPLPFPVVEQPLTPLIPPRDDQSEGMRGGGIALAGFLASTGAVIAIALLFDALDVDGLITLVVAQGVGWSALFMACLTAVRRYGDGSLRELGLSGLSGPDVWSGFKSGLLLRLSSIVIALIVIIGFGRDVGGEPSVSRGFELTTGATAVLIAIVVLGAPFFEELFFRGLVFAILTRRFGARRALFLQAALFATVHLWPTMSARQIVLVFSTICFTGFFLGQLRWRSRSLGPSMVSHAVFNLTAVLVFLAVD